MTFKDRPKEELQALGKRSGLLKRSPELQVAWDKASEIKRKYKEGISTIQLAEDYKVQRRMIYRILNN